jgi:tetratricopeptide (TPR) repeat protein
MGKPSLAKPLAEKLIKADPLVPLYQYALFAIHLLEKRVDLAVALAGRLLEMEPGNRVTQYWYAEFLARNKQTEEALAVIEQIAADGQEDLIALCARFLKLGLKGERESAAQSMTAEVKKGFWNDPEGPWLAAGWWALLDEKQEAICCLERAVDRGWINHPLFNEADPFLENIRGEERFRQLMKKVKYEWEHFEV